MNSHVFLGFPGSSAGEESACNAGDTGSIPGWVGKVPWKRNRLPTPVFWGFPGGSDGKESACNAGDVGFIPGSGRSPGGQHGNPLQNSCLENPMPEEPGRLQSIGSQSQTRLSDSGQHSITVISVCGRAYSEQVRRKLNSLIIPPTKVTRCWSHKHLTACFLDDMHF